MKIFIFENDSQAPSLRGRIFSAVVHDLKNQSQFKDRVKDGLPDI